MEFTIGFSRSERSRNNLGRNSNCSGRMFHGREKLDWAAGFKTHFHQWLLSFYRYPANCLALYLLSSMAITATICQVYVSGSVGTEVVVVVQIPIGQILQRLWLFYLAPLQPNQHS